MSARSIFLVTFLFSALIPFSLAAAEFKFGPNTFTVPDGYSVEHVAGPPLVNRPVNMAFDESGVLYVTDSSGSNEKLSEQIKNPTHRVMRLVDKNGDGVFDESTVFADKLSFPEGAMWKDGSLYVGVAPVIWKLTDTDGNHVADKREVWFDGGSLSGCGNDLHGPYAGLDGCIYWCKGEFAQQRHRLADGRDFVSRAAHVYRAKPDGGGLEVVLTGGMNNPVGVAFSAIGERFVSGTFFDLSGGGKRDGILHAVYGGVFGRVNDGVLQGHPRTGDLLPVMKQLGPAAPAGMVSTRGDSLGARGDLVCAEFNMHRVSRHTLTPEGATFKAGSSDLLVSDQTDFHPTDVLEDADGSLLIADTGGWYRLCCPTSTIAKPEVLGAIYRVRKTSAPKVEDPRGLNLDWTKPDAAWLGDARPAVVERTITGMARQGRVSPLLGAKNRVPAIWALNRIPGDAARAAVRSLLTESDPSVLSAAMESVTLWRDYAAVEPLSALLKSPDPHLRRIAATGLGRIGDRRAIAPLLEAAAQNNDRFLQHAIAYALFEIGDVTSLPPDESSGTARVVRKMFATVAEAKTLPSIPFPKDAAPLALDPAALAKQRARLDEIAALLPSADARRGDDLFKNVAKSLCMTCHTFGSSGASFGPDLTKIGAIRGERELLESILYPSAILARYYEPVIVRKRGGGEAMGLMRKDGADEIIIASAPGAEMRIPRNEVSETQYSGTSLMPQSFDGLLTPQQIADIVVFLRSAK